MNPCNDVRAVETFATGSTGKHSRWFSKPVVVMAAGAGAHPGCEFVCGASIVCALAVVAEVAGNLFPLRPVPGTGSGEGVCHFVQKHLVNFVVLVKSSKVFRDRDALVREITEPGASAGVIEPK